MGVLGRGKVGTGFLREAVPGGWRMRRMHKGGRVEEMERPFGLKTQIKIQLSGSRCKPGLFKWL